MAVVTIACVITACGGKNTNQTADTNVNAEIEDTTIVANQEDDTVTESDNSINDQILDVENIWILMNQDTSTLDSGYFSTYYYHLDNGQDTSTTCSFSYYGLNYETDITDQAANIAFSKDKYNEIVNLILSNPITPYTYPTDEAGKVLYTTEDYVMVLGIEGMDDGLFHSIPINLPTNFDEILNQFNIMKDSAVADNKPDGVSSMDVSPENIETYTIPDLTITLENSGDGQTHYILVTVVLSMDKSSVDYGAYGSADAMTSYEDMIKAQITQVIGSYTLDEIRQHENEARATLLEKIQELFGSNFIYDVSFSSMIYQ